MRKGDHVVVIAGDFRGMAGIIRRRTRAGGFIVNIDGGRTGIPRSPLLKASEIRRVEKRQGEAR